MANVSYLRESGTKRRIRSNRGGFSVPRRRRRGPYIAGGLLLALVAVAGAAAAVIGLSKPKLTADPTQIAKLGLPLGGATVQSFSVTTGPNAKTVPAVIGADHVIRATRPVPAGTRMDVQVVVRRPGWIAWLTGHTQRLDLTVTAPTARLRSQYVTVRSGAPIRLHFTTPIRAYAFGPSAGRLRRHVLAAPTTTLSLPRTATAGSAFLAATPRTWESARAQAISWFPAGHTATAVASPAPGSRIRSTTPITLTFSKPISRVLGSHLPPVSPATQGTWHVMNSHAIQFRPQGYGYGLGATVKVALPDGVRLIGGQRTSDASGGSWSVPAGSTARLQQVLAQLGYLPLDVSYGGAAPGLSPQEQEAAAVNPPTAKFRWRYPNTPSWMVGAWQPGTYGEITKAAVMTFENQSGLAADGVAGPQVWKALINAVIHDRRNTFGYTVADVSMSTPESLTVWHDGSTVLTTAVNTGISQSPTAPGTFAVYEHLPVTTMSGTNPDGSHYHDPGIPWVSYFNGGDALHGFIRGSYGTPQSLGCVEMPFDVAKRVYPYTPIGTIVHVA